MSKFTVRCSDAVALARTNFFICQCVKLGCGTHDIELVLSSVARAPLCRLTASGRFTSARTRIRWCFTCLVCVSVTATRPCPPRTRHHCNRRPRGCRLRIFARTDGLTQFICSYLNILVWMFSRLHAPTLICPCGIHQSGTSTLSPDGMLRIYLGETRIRWPFACLVCVSVTTTRPCTPRTRHHCGHRHQCVHRRRRGAYLRLFTRTDSRNYVYSFGNPHSGNMYASTFMRPCTVWLDSELCSFSRYGEFSLRRKMLQT